MKLSRLSFIALIGASVASLTGCGGGHYEDGQLYAADGTEEEDFGSITQDLSTSFSPASDSLKFNNSFKNDFFAGITTSGLCGGMVYTTLDYFYDPKGVPLQDYRPAVGYGLRDYLYRRQVNSLERNADKWAELGFNPGGIRNDEFWRWGLQKTGRVAELRKSLDAGTPVPLGLHACDGCGVGNHQVLAIGYELGAYNAAQAGYPDLKIFIYDPSYPKQRRTLRTDLASKRWYDADNTNRRWLTYFVDGKYTKSVPPSASTPANGLVVSFYTGGDDLRGGSDNVNIKVTFKDNTTQTFSNVNRGGRWIDNSAEQVAVSVPTPSNVKSITISTTFGGGIGGDNWNLNRVVVHDLVTYKTGARRVDKAGAPLLKRFTGDSKTFTLTLD